MPFFPNNDGSALHLDWIEDAPEITRRLERKETYYGTLAGAVLYGNVQATAFDQPLKAVDVYDGTEALSSVFHKKPLPAPIGKQSQYRIVVLDGQFYHPPISPPANAVDCVK